MIALTTAAAILGVAIVVAVAIAHWIYQPPRCARCGGAAEFVAFTLGDWASTDLCRECVEAARADGSLAGHAVFGRR